MVVSTTARATAVVNAQCPLELYRSFRTTPKGQAYSRRLLTGVVCVSNDAGYHRLWCDY